MAQAMMWRLAAADRRGVPYTDDRAATVVVGVTEDLGLDGRAWFRATGRGDAISRSPVVAEIRTGDRARERAEQATGIYSERGWVVVDGPRVVDVGNPGLTARELLEGRALALWAAGISEAFRRREL